MEKAEFDKLVEQARETFKSAPSPIQVMWNGHDFILASEAWKFVEESGRLRARLAEAEGRIFELETLLAKLTNDHTPEQKRIIELRDVQGMTWKAIVETMGMSLDKVRSNYIRGYMLARKKKALQHPQGTEGGENGRA